MFVSIFAGALDIDPIAMIAIEDGEHAMEELQRYLDAHPEAKAVEIAIPPA